MSEKWQCEGCGEMRTGDPAHIETYPGHEERVELWFCAECEPAEKGGRR